MGPLAAPAPRRGVWVTDNPIAPLLAAIDAASRWLESNDVRAAVVGGVAASIHGNPRMTKDVDLVALADLEDCERLVQAAAAHGIEPRSPDVVEFAQTTRVLLLRHAATRVELDVSLGALPFEADLVANSRPTTVSGVRFRLALPEDIIIMKALALRPRDVADIAAIVGANDDLDLDRVRATVEAFSAMLEEGDLVSELNRILAGAERRT